LRLVGQRRHAGGLDRFGRLAELVTLVRGLGMEFGPVVFPVHPRTHARLEDAGLRALLASAEGVELREPLPYEELLERLAARGKPAEIVIRLTVQQCFFHCAKAFIRSRLWEHHAWPARTPLSFGKYLAAKMDGDAEAAREIDEAIEQDYRTNL
jgi:hypothetical protein